MDFELAFPARDFDCKSLLREWRWLVPSDMKPILIGVFGDWVFEGKDYSIWHLDLLEGSFHQIANSRSEFDSLKENSANMDLWFSEEWASIALQNGLKPGKNECFGWALAPVLGGPLSLENISVFPMSVYQSICGQMFRQI